MVACTHGRMIFELTDLEQQAGNHYADKQVNGILVSFLVAILPPVVSEWCVRIHEVEISKI